MNIPVFKNNDYEIEITGIGHNGEGVGRIDNFTVFVQDAIPGERALVKIIKIEKSFAISKLISLITESEYRAEPACPIYKRCGGCNIQHITYKGQLQFKRQRVVDAIQRIGKLDGIVVKDVIGMDNPYRYRNKVQLPVGITNNEINIGFYAPRSHDIIDMDSCGIQSETADEVTRIVRQWIQKFNIKVYDEKMGTGVLRHIMIRNAFRTGDTMVVIVTNKDDLSHKQELVDMLLSGVKNITGIIQNINKNKTNVILGDECKTIWGSDTITDYIGEFRFNISPKSFFQVNPVQTEVLYNKALEYAQLTGNETVFDAYCGAGTISLFLAQQAKKVYGVEIVPEAIENAIENAKNNGVTNTEFIVGEAEKVIPEMITNGIKADVVVVDPPRKGCEIELLQAISKMAPERIVYVSCDPGTLARDLGILDELGYKTVEVQPVDMFPQSMHVETVVLMAKVK